MPGLKPTIAEIILEHLEILKEKGMLPDAWEWDKEKLKDLENCVGNLLWDIKKVYRAGFTNDKTSPEIKKELERLKALLEHMYNSNNLGRGMQKHEKDLVEGLLAYIEPEIAQTAQHIEDFSLSDKEIEIYASMLDNMKNEILLLNSESEVIRNGFDYPIKLYLEFKNKIQKLLKKRIRPDIGIVGYGSLQSPSSLSKTIGRAVKPDYVIVKNIIRGAFFASINRFKPNIEQIGANNNLSCMGIKHKKGTWFNGVRISGLKSEELLKLGVREFYYFMLPIGKAKTMEGKTYEFNLACWPMGQNLLRRVRQKEGSNGWYARTIGALGSKSELRSMAFSTISRDEKERLFRQAESLARKSMGNPSQEQLKQNRGLVQQLRQKADEYLKQIITTGKLQFRENPELSKALQRRYIHLVNNFTSMDNRFEPNLNYMYTCMQIGDAQQEHLFLESTWCYDPEGNLIPFKDYLTHYGAKSNNRRRFQFSPKSGKF